MFVADPTRTEDEHRSHPREFILLGDDLLLVANQNTSRLCSFKLDPVSGVPCWTGHVLATETPIAMLALPPLNPGIPTA
jgi:6-phosphogluconolactonase (cycloisomerase 2 family)